MNGFTPPRFLTLSMAASRIHMVMSLFLLGMAVLLDGPGRTSTNNYYYVLLGIPRETFPALSISAALCGAGAIVLLRKRTMLLSLVMGIAGIPFLVYCASATYYVYFVLESRTFVTAALYWSAAGAYYIAVLISVGIGLWVELLKLHGRHHAD